LRDKKGDIEFFSTIETAYLKKAVELAGGNKSKAADYLNLSLKSIRYCGDYFSVLI